MVETTPYSVPREPGRWRAIGMAVAVHAALFVFLWIGIRWQSETPVAIEAEVWDMQAKEAAPRQSLPPEPKPEPKPEPEPVRKPEPKPVEKTPVEKPEIALEQERKKKEKAKREEEERLARLKEEKEQAEKEKQAALEKQQAALEKQKADALAKKKKEEADKKRQEAQMEKLLAQTRAEEMKRIAGATAGSGGTGTAEKSQGMRGDPSYASKVAAKIKSNTAFSVPPDLMGNPEVEYDVQLFPDGSLRGAPRKVKSSGIAAFDDAVRRAIELSAPYPADKSGTVPSGFSLKHRPKEQ